MILSNTSGAERFNKAVVEGEQAFTKDQNKSKSSTDTDLVLAAEMNLEGKPPPMPMREVKDERTSSSTTELPLDGGWAAWCCVLGAHLVVLNTWGVINSFGVFQAYYVTSLDRSPSEISWIGSIEIFLLFFVGTFSGRLTDGGYFRSVTIVGAGFVVMGTLVTSVCTKYWQIFLTQGICLGLGNGLLFCPSVAIVSTYFHRRRSTAIGITACGSGVGGIIFPLLVRELLPRIGFGWTMRTIGFIQAVLLSIALTCLKPCITPRKAGPIVEWAALKELEYCFCIFGSFLCFWGSFIAFFYLSAYSRAVQHFSYGESLNLIVILNGVGLIGRVVPNYFADRVGPLTLFVPFVAASGVFMFCWIGVQSPKGLYAWAAICGVAIGGIQSLFPSVMASLTTEPEKQGSRIGTGFTVVSFSVLTGPPIIGALLSMLDGHYMAAQAFAGSSVVLGALLLLASRELKRRKAGAKMWDKV